MLLVSFLLGENQGKLLLALRAGTKNQAGFVRLGNEARNNKKRGAQESFDFRAGAIRRSNPNDLGRRAEQDASFLKVRILGHNGEAVFLCKLPDRGVVRAA